MTARRYGRRVLIAAAALVGLAAGRVLAPVRRRARVTLTWWPLLPAGAAAQVGAGRLDDAAALATLLVGYACLLAFATANLHLTGTGVIAVGLACNVVPLALNGGMPVRASALVDAGIIDAVDVEAVELRGSRHVAGDDDILAGLGDIVPVPAADRVVSFGDLILVVGVADAVAQLTRRRRRSLSTNDARRADHTLRTPSPRAASSSNNARPDQDWGDAPIPVPSSGSQYSAKPDASAPDTVAGPTPAPARASR